MIVITVLNFFLALVAFLSVIIGSLDALLNKDPEKRNRKWIIFTFAIFSAIAACVSTYLQNSDKTEIIDSVKQSTTTIGQKIDNSKSLLLSNSDSNTNKILKKLSRTGTKSTKVVQYDNSHNINGSNNKVGVNGDINP
jgi:hypothetical protein